jgi:hypothetical protein
MRALHLLWGRDQRLVTLGHLKRPRQERRWGADAPMPRRLNAFLLKVDVVYTVSLSDLPNATCAAARRAMGTR